MDTDFAGDASCRACLSGALLLPFPLLFLLIELGIGRRPFKSAGEARSIAFTKRQLPRHWRTVTADRLNIQRMSHLQLTDQFRRRVIVRYAAAGEADDIRTLLWLPVID